MLLASASNSDAFVSAIAIVAFIGLPIAYAMVNRFLAHQERMEMLRRGITPPPDPKWARKAAKRGWYAQGPYAASPPPPPPGMYAQYDPYAQFQADRYLRKGITLAMIGLALLIGLSFIDNFTHTPGPWLLGGLIPMFAGIAQIIIALLSGARFGPFVVSGMPPQGPAAQAPPHPEQQAAPFSGPRDVTPGPYAWRPGPTTELEPPPSPPDVR